MLRNFTNTFFLKKGRMVFGLLPFFIVITSCVDPSQYGRVVKSSPSSKNSFIFSVKEEYLNSHKDSKIDEKYKKMTEAEVRLLESLLKQQNYCINEEGEVAFSITSRQEKIYDMTFAHLIEQSYNARPLTPVMYYGVCVSQETVN
ncbi:MAG: hypothetical protein KGQ36_03285 [Rickettsiales bacterium]|nr:hypothetical protein [Rickettsiales bacterium]